MSDSVAKDRKIVYSTDSSWRPECPVCALPEQDCICEQPAAVKPQQQTAYLRRESKHRGGKTVTTVSELSGDLKSLQKELQKLCGTGGTLKNNVIEIQGDHRDKIRSYLEEKGYRVKLAGG